ncbi:unnamed protein product [Cyprideis torosa]|uniref:Transglutaminase-like domain-containing protein n=1 Tax=Cyprideis torosa TaxID=163714 RepID=A0A7R8ZKA2_9CRUS|nr:unnamed protein product [Cyprideis torosa]CAG0884046.1 unnamed protein product [Cyprideis torosa]
MGNVCRRATKSPPCSPSVADASFEGRAITSSSSRVAWSSPADTGNSLKSALASSSNRVYPSSSPNQNAQRCLPPSSSTQTLQDAETQTYQVVTTEPQQVTSRATQTIEDDNGLLMILDSRAILESRLSPPLTATASDSKTSTTKKTGATRKRSNFTGGRSKGFVPPPPSPDTRERLLEGEDEGGDVESGTTSSESPPEPQEVDPPSIAHDDSASDVEEISANNTIFKKDTASQVSLNSRHGRSRRVANSATHDHDPSPGLSRLHKSLGDSGESATSSCCQEIAEALERVVAERIRQEEPSLVIYKDIGIQTENDFLTDEAPEYAARPPATFKSELWASVPFERGDEIAFRIPHAATLHPKTLVGYIVKKTSNPYLIVRAVFRWIAENITYDWNLMDAKLSTQDILRVRAGVCQEFVQLFSELCGFAGIRVKTLHGFAKGMDTRAGHHFKPGMDISHTWNFLCSASFISASDTRKKHDSDRLPFLFHATGYTDPKTGAFQRRINEHYFFTDPEEMVWTHYPYDEGERNYERYQLSFKPHDITVPFVIFNSRRLHIAGTEVMRFQYKFFPISQPESRSLNQYVFCWLCDHRLAGSFTIQPPETGDFYIKVYAKRETEINEGSCLDHICMLLVRCVKVFNNIRPWPRIDIPWGITEAFFLTGAGLHKMTSPRIVTWGGKKELTLEKSRPLVIRFQFFDADGNEYHTKGIIGKEETETEIKLTIQPPKVGMYKLLLFGCPRPRTKTRLHLPLIGAFLVECKNRNNAEGKGEGGNNI